MNQIFYDAVENSPVIAAVKNQEGLARCVQSERVMLFLFSMETSAILQIL